MRNVEDFVIWVLRGGPSDVAEIHKRLNRFGFSNDEIDRAAENLIKEGKIKSIRGPLLVPIGELAESG